MPTYRWIFPGEDLWNRASFVRPIEKILERSGQYDELRYTRIAVRFVAGFRTVVSIDVIKSEIRIWCKITYGTYGLQIEMNILCATYVGYVHGDFLGYLEDPSFLADHRSYRDIIILSMLDISRYILEEEI